MEEISNRQSICAMEPERSQVTIQVPKDRVTVWNNGHTIQVTSPQGTSLIIGAAAFPLSQFHFHSPSEHSIEGSRPRWKSNSCFRTAMHGRRFSAPVALRPTNDTVLAIASHRLAELEACRLVRFNKLAAGQ